MNKNKQENKVVGFQLMNRHADLSQSMIQNKDDFVVQQSQFSQVLSKQNFKPQSVKSLKAKIKEKQQPFQTSIMQINNLASNILQEEAPCDNLSQNKAKQINANIVIQQSHLQLLDLTPLDAYSKLNHHKIDNILSKVSGSRMPESHTPLVFSKELSVQSSKRRDRDRAKAIILKVKLVQARDNLQDIKRLMLYYSQVILEQSSNMLNDYYFQFKQFRSEYSIKLQESLFSQKQEYQQLKYQFQNMKIKPITTTDMNRTQSRLSIKDQHSVILQLQEAKKNNLKMTEALQKLMQQNDRLKEDKIVYKRQISEIREQIMQVKHSNNELYELIFDLQQKIAFHESQKQKMAEEIRQKTEKCYGQKILVLEQSLQKDRIEYEKRCKSLQSNNFELKQDTMKLKEQVQRLSRTNLQQEQKLSVENELSLIKRQEQIIKLREDIKNLEGELQHTMKQIQMKNQTILQLEDQLEKYRRINSHINKVNMIEDMDLQTKTYQNKSSKQEKLDNQRHQLHYYQTNNRNNLEIQRLMLQKQVLLLKTELNSHKSDRSNSQNNNKMQERFSQQKNPIKQYHFYYSTNTNHELPHPTNNIIIQSNHEFDKKQRSQSERNNLKRHRSSQYSNTNTLNNNVLPKNINKGSIDYSKTQHNQYGIKNKLDNYCSVQAKNIINKVKQRKNQEANHNHNALYDQCPVNNQIRIQSNYSRVNPSRNEQKSQNKMKVLQDKVKRLRTQLKSSMSSNTK